MTGHDVDRQVEAVLDVLAPKIDAGEFKALFGPQRWPIFRFDYEGQMVVPDDDQVRHLAEQIVTATRTASGGTDMTAGQQLCRAHPDDCPNGPEPHTYRPPELPCCRQPGEGRDREETSF